MIFFQFGKIEYRAALKICKRKKPANLEIWVDLLRFCKSANANSEIWVDLLNLQICKPGPDSLLGGGWLLTFERFVPFVCLASCPKQWTKDFRREYPKRSETQTYATKPEAGRGSFCVITGCTPKTLSRTVMITKPSTCAFSNFWAIRV